jgi:hypothetical protein
LESKSDLIDIEKSKRLSSQKAGGNISESLTHETQINRLVDLAVMIHYRCGKAQFEMVALQVPEFERANFDTKVRMVKYLQDLRLLLWILRQDAPFPAQFRFPMSSTKSSFTLGADLALSVWNREDLAIMDELSRILHSDRHGFQNHVEKLHPTSTP